MIAKCFIVIRCGFIPRCGIFIEVTEFNSKNGGLYTVQSRVHPNVIVHVLHTLPVVGNHAQLKIPARAKNTNHVFHQYTLQLVGNTDREKLREHLASKGVPMMIYYPIPLHMQKAYKDDRYKPGDFPVTEQLCKVVFSLPMHTELTEDQLKLITESVLEFLK